MTSLKIRSFVPAFALLMLLLAAGCSPSPEKVGDACEVDGDPCPSGSVCAPGGDDHTCQVVEIESGGACDPAESPERCKGDLVCSASHDAKGGGTCGIAEGGACEPTDPNSRCAGNMACAELSAGGHACYPPVLVKGKVFDSSSKAAIGEAQIMALDDQATAVTDISVSNAEGNYTLAVPVQRNEDGSPVADVLFTLRAGAKDYQTFPGGLRTALPISSSDAQKKEDGWNLQLTLTDIALIGLPDDEKGRPSITGKVVAEAQSAGVLVVAEDADGTTGHSAITDKSGAYTIFNVPDGDYTVRGFAAGLQLTPATAKMSGMALTGIDLAKSADALGTISGSVNIVNPGEGMATSVVLVVASTFSDTFVRGEVPRGLRSPLSGTPNVTGAFEIKDVPAGKYKVLAAFENDALVRDPDPNIAGTQIVEIEMPTPGMAMPLPESFKVTGALSVIGPGAEDAQAVTAAPMLEWADDSSEDFYTVVVYNAYGELVWCRSDDPMLKCTGGNIPGVSGSEKVSVQYDGPMEPGMYYQFRATSWRAPGGEPGPASNTEDLRGVFYVDAGAMP
ncbi:carboxypeptidase-like regulatory domain-containing protein [Polyangium aurulentum]|uniref:carboxypeptidase-like regulatory domain-containing protein n=1 Tax=Polyangium aurulentum TaxID=2567896 RepID=UPI00146C1BDE|nr:carboxypeptidase-like regulatory domain-containing protein [Polyangium aurulentum]UQA58353.1 hypothetical protein E8A73_045095 [Polyangium aurulentum]